VGGWWVGGRGGGGGRKEGARDSGREGVGGIGRKGGREEGEGREEGGRTVDSPSMLSNVSIARGDIMGNTTTASDWLFSMNYRYCAQYHK